MQSHHQSRLSLTLELLELLRKVVGDLVALRDGLELGHERVTAAVLGLRRLRMLRRLLLLRLVALVVRLLLLQLRWLLVLLLLLLLWLLLLRVPLVLRRLIAWLVLHAARRRSELLLLSGRRRPACSGVERRGLARIRHCRESGDCTEQSPQVS
jgi:hypothetical protein